MLKNRSAMMVFGGQKITKNLSQVRLVHFLRSAWERFFIITRKENSCLHKQSGKKSKPKIKAWRFTSKAYERDTAYSSSGYVRKTKMH